MVGPCSSPARELATDPKLKAARHVTENSIA
jgi:hypothetical protein